MTIRYPAERAVSGARVCKGITTREIGILSWGNEKGFFRFNEHVGDSGQGVAKERCEIGL
jgi:hypothetical protein